VLQHVSIEVHRDQVAEHLRFWLLLGFEQVEPPGAVAERSTWVQRDGTQIHLLHAEQPVVPPEGHVAVVVPDYDTALADLRAEGYEPQPRTQHWGAPRAFVHAPGGHVVEVMAAPPT
jgi:catechol 2,3-dioxygenase-like lactoylglutathione lyase family enzyme